MWTKLQIGHWPQGDRLTIRNFCKGSSHCVLSSIWDDCKNTKYVCQKVHVSVTKENSGKSFLSLINVCLEFPCVLRDIRVWTYLL